MATTYIDFCLFTRYGSCNLTAYFAVIWNLKTSNKMYLIQPSIKYFEKHSLNRILSIKLTKGIGYGYLTHKRLLHVDTAPTCQACSPVLAVRHILMKVLYSIIYSLNILLMYILPYAIYKDTRIASIYFHFLGSLVSYK